MSWRTMDGTARVEARRRINERIDDRYAQGIERYGLDLEGDPIEHLEEELIDALIYLQWVKRERLELSREIGRLMDQKEMPV